jgi:hypothetical protein
MKHFCRLLLLLLLLLLIRLLLLLLLVLLLLLLLLLLIIIIILECLSAVVMCNSGLVEEMRVYIGARDGNCQYLLSSPQRAFG